MKINKAKLLVGTLAIASVAATVGSISGTVAWFQYSTRSTAAYVGTSAKCSESLQIRIYDTGTTGYDDAAWQSDLVSTDVATYLAARTGAGNGSTFAPVTYGAATKAAALPNTGDFASGPKANPVYQFFPYSSWENAATGDYVVIPLQLKLNDLDGAGGVYAGKSVYLANLTLQQKSGDTHGDLSSALRVHFASAANMLYAKNTDDTSAAVSTTVGTYLDLNGDGRYDKTVGYEWDTTTATVYGTAGTQTAYNAAAAVGTADINPMVNDTNAKLTTTGATALGVTNASGILNVTVTIWLEGWAELDGANAVIDTLADKTAIEGVTSKAAGDTYKALDDGKVWRWSGTAWEEVTKESVWDLKYIGSQFQVGMRFVVDTL